jgi:hypothetical protein
MDGFELKRSVVATFERIHQFNTDERLESLEVLWHGETAGIRWEGRNNAKLFLPAIDERKNFPKSMLFKLVGFVIHELGHLWYTDTEVWDKAVEGHSPLLHRLINGLEDPRIELEVIRSHRAANARTLLESLVQSMLAKNPDYIKANDIENYPFLLAIEGRRLNGYSIPVPNIIPQSPDVKALTVALNDAHHATSTAEIVVIAKRLFDAIQKRKRKKPEDKSEDKPEDQPGDSQDQEGDSQDQEGDSQDQEGEKNEPTSGKGNEKKPIDVEPGDHIEEDMEEYKLKTRYGGDNRSAVGKPVVYNFHFD